MSNNYHSSRWDPAWVPSKNTFFSSSVVYSPPNSFSFYCKTLLLGLLLWGGIVVVGTAQVSAGGPYGPVCKNGTDVTLIGSPAGGMWTSTHTFTPATGFNNGGTTTAVFDPSSVPPGTYTFTYTVGSDMASTNIIVNAVPVVGAGGTAGDYGTVCEDATDVVLVGSPVPTGAQRGIWTGSGTGVTDPINTDANAVFDPSGNSGVQRFDYTFTDENGCSNAAMAMIDVKKAATLIPSKDTSICANSPAITLAGTPATPGEGTWGGVGLTNINKSAGTATFTPTGLNGQVSLTYTYEDPSGCMDVVSRNINVNPVPVVNAVPNITVCAGETVNPINFTGSSVPATVYNWSRPNNDVIGINTSGTGNINSFVAQNTGTSDIVSTITVTPTANGCSGTSISFTLRIKPTPVIVFDATRPPTMCSMDDGAIKFTGLAANTNYTVNYKKNGTPTSVSITTNGTVGSDSIMVGAGSYTDISVITTGNCTSNIIAGPITISDPASPTVNQLSNQTLCYDGMPISVTVTGNAERYNWSINNGFSFSNTSIVNTTMGAMVTITPPTVNSFPVTATVTVTPENTTTGCIGTPMTFNITVKPTPSVNAITNVTACHGETVNAVNFTGSLVANTVYSWTNNTNIGLASSGTGNLPSFIASNTSSGPVTSTITVTPSFDGCSGASETFSITVNPKPTISIGTVTNPTTCGGTDGAIEIKGINNTDTFNLSYTFSGVSIDVMTNEGPGVVDTMIEMLGAGNYSNILIKQYECESNALSQSLSDPNAPTVDSISDQTICIGDSSQVVNLSGTSGATFTWVKQPSSDSLATSGNLLTGTAMVPKFGPLLTNYVNIDSTTITVTPTLNSCTGAPETFKIYVQPRIDPGSYDTVCVGGSTVNLTTNLAFRNGETGVWSGPGVTNVNSATGTAEFDPTGLEGLQTLNFKLNASYACSKTDTFRTIFVQALNNVDAGMPRKVCQGSAIINLTGVPNPSAGQLNSTGTWSGDGITDASVTDAMATFNPNGLSGPITVYYRYVDGSTGCSRTDSTVITVTPLPIADAGTYPSMCPGDAAITVTGGPALRGMGETGKWTGPGITDADVDDLTATFDPTGLSGSVTLTYEYTDSNSCSDIATTTIFVSPPANIDAQTQTPVCANASPVTITGNIIPPANAKAYWSGTGVMETDSSNNIAMFDPTGLLANSPVRLTYTYVDTAGCMESDTTSIIINALPVVNAGNDTAVCENVGSINLVGMPDPAVTGGGAMGTWSGSGVTNGSSTDNVGTFNPVNLSGDVKLVYTYKDANGCEVGDTVVFTIKAPEAGSYGPVCLNTDLVDLVGKPAPTLPGEKGVWSGTGVTDLSDGDAVAKFNPMTAGPNVVTYTFTDANGCTDGVSTTIQVTQLPTVTAGSYGPVCENANPISLQGGPVPAGNTTGVWKGDGVTNINAANGTANFNPNGLSGNITLTYIYTAASGCIDSAMTTIAITSLQTPSLTLGSTAVCESASNVALTGDGSNLGTWSGSGVVNVSGNNAQFDPSGLSGNITLTYTYAHTGGCTGTKDTIIRVNPQPIVETGTYAAVCEGAMPITLTGNPVPSTGESGTWSGPGVKDGSSIDANGIFYSDTAGVGMHTIKYKFMNASGCVDSNTTVINVQAAPVVTITTILSDTICPDAGNINLAATPVPNTVGETGTWSMQGITDNSNTDATAVFNPSGLSGDVEITYTYLDNTGCSATARDTVFVKNITVTTGTYGPICASGSPIALDMATPAINADGGAGVWTGAGVTGSGPYTFDPSGLSGTIILTYTFTDGNGCSKQANTGIQITSPPVSAGTYSAVCDNATPVQLVGTPAPNAGETGVWKVGTGVTDANTNDAVGIFTPSGQAMNSPIQLIYTFTAANGCVNADTTMIVVRDTVAPNAGTDQTVCEKGGMVMLSGSPVPNPNATDQKGTWSGTGVTNVNSANGTAMFDPTGLNGTVTLTYTFTDANSCSGSDEVIYTVTNLQANVGGPYADVCESGTSVTLSGTPNTGTWSGQNVTDNANGTGTFDPSGLSGAIKLYYTVTNTAGCTDVDSTTINVVSPTVNAGTYPAQCVGANPINLIGSPVPVSGQLGEWMIVSTGTTPTLTDLNNTDGVGTLTPDVAGTFKFEYTFTDANGCVSKDTTEITINALPTINAGTYASLCAESGPITVMGSPFPAATGEKGTWSGPGITDSNTGDASASFNPAGLSGTVTLTYTFLDDTGCEASGTTTIMIDNTIISAEADFRVCRNSGTQSIMLTGSALPSGATTVWSGQGVTEDSGTNNTATFQPNGLSGTVEAYYTLTNAAGCVSRDTTKITIITPSAGTYGPICKAASPITITGSPLPLTTTMPNAEMARWEVNGTPITTASGVASFDPSAANVPVGQNRLSYIFTDANGCVDSAWTMVTVTGQVALAITSPTVDSICGDAPVTLIATPAPTGNATGTWSGQGVTDANTSDNEATFNPTGLTGHRVVTYTYNDGNGCTNTITKTIGIRSLAVEAGPDIAVCDDSGFINLSATATYNGVALDASGGTWLGVGVPNSGVATFDPTGRNGETTVTYTYTINGCTQSDTKKITVFNPTASVTAISDQCQSSPAITVTGSPTPSGGATGTWSGPGLSNINSAAGTATFNSASVTVTGGSTSVTLTYTFSVSGCTESASTTFTVNGSGSVIASAVTDTVCTGGLINLSAVSSNVSALSWSTNGSGTFSNASGTVTTYTPTGTFTGSSRVDQITLTGTAAASSCPTPASTINVLVVKSASVDLGADIASCDNSSQTLTPVSLGTGNTVVWSSNNGTFDNTTLGTPTYTPNLPFNGATRTDQITVQATDQFGFCPVETDQLNITLTNAVSITEGTTGTVCSGDSIVLNNNVPAVTASFTTDVVGNRGTIVVHEGKLQYVPNPNGSTTIRRDTVRITNPDVDGNGPCTATTSQMIVDVLPNAVAQLVADTTICEGETINLLVATFGQQDTLSSRLSTSLTTYPSTAITLNGTEVKDTITYGTSITGSNCSATIDQVIVTIRPRTTMAIALRDTTICEVNPVQVSAGAAATDIQYLWSVLGGTGTLNDSSLASPTYTPNAGLTTTSRVDTLVLNTTRISNICETGRDTMLVTVLQTGSFSAIPDTTICSSDVLALEVQVQGTLTQFVWSGNNGSFARTDTAATTYTPNAVGTGTRMDTLIASLTFGSGACPVVMDSAFVTVVGQVVVNAGSDVTICEGNSQPLTGTVGAGATSVTWSVLNSAGSFSRTDTLATVYTPSGTVTSARQDTILLTTNDPDGPGGCLPSADTVIVIIRPTPTVSLGGDIIIFDGQTASLSVQVSEPVAVNQWTQSNGSFLNTSPTLAEYRPNPLNGASSRVDQVIYEAQFQNATCANQRDTILITVNAPNAISKADATDFCGDLCLTEHTLSIDPNTNTLVVLANNINPADNCPANSQFDFRLWQPSMAMAEPNTVIDVPNLPTTLTFDCDDRGKQLVNVYVSSSEENTQLCPVTIEVVDNAVTCGERRVAGTIRTTQGEPMVGVEVFVQEMSEVGGVVPDPIKTDAEGKYEFMLKTDRQYEITPMRDEDLAEGVTAFDNVVISRHILNLETFTSPFQTIAADVNKSGSVTAFDIVLIRKVVLAREQEFTNNTSWRFIDASFEFSDVETAASADFKESFTVTETTGNVDNMDFVAVKVGDANGTAKPSGSLVSGTADDRNDFDKIVFQTENRLLEKGQIYEVPFQLLDGEKVESYQFTLDHRGLTLLDIQAGVATADHFGRTLTKRGLLTACWSASSPELSRDNWFTLRFKAEKNGYLSELLDLNSAVTPIEAYTADFENVGIELAFTQPIESNFELFQNKPNPFQKETVVSFVLPEASAGELTILDMQGRTLRTLSDNYEAGYNEVTLDFTDLPKGVFYYRLETVFGTKVQKMLRVE
ncbi:MAG: T9SS type A sorting domain-containing protein [Bacteroidota bacterium]